MPAHKIADKFRRSIRNETGATFTLEQMREMASYGMLAELARLEAEELWPTGEQAPIQRSAEPEKKKHPTDSKRGRLSIAELSKGL